MDYYELKGYRRDAILGALGAFLMLVGDLSLSLIPTCESDSGLFVREAYLDGRWESWRFPLLVFTGLVGMTLCFFSLRLSWYQVKVEYRKTRLIVISSLAIVIATAAALHLYIGSLADWTTTLSPLLGRKKTIDLVYAQFNRVMKVMFLPYFGLALFMLSTGYAVLRGKTILPRWMIMFHAIVFQLFFVLVPDISRALGRDISIWDYILSQGSTNASLCIWMLSNAVWAGFKKRKMNNTFFSDIE